MPEDCQRTKQLTSAKLLHRWYESCRVLLSYLPGEILANWLTFIAFEGTPDSINALVMSLATCLLAVVT